MLTILKDAVVVIREGQAVPTMELLRVVNNAHAVLALRGENQYFYLRDDFVLSAREEEAVIEWGVGRSLLGNSVLAVGGTLLVAFAEQIWRPAIVGTLLVAAAGYRVQGALTKVLRVRSPAWSDNMLVPSGIHGTERAVQGVLVMLVALADLLDNRVLLLTALVLASGQVVVLECVGQAVLTWGRERYSRVLSVQLVVWTCYCAGLVFFLWLSYLSWGLPVVLLCLFTPWIWWKAVGLRRLAWNVVEIREIKYYVAPFVWAGCGAAIGKSAKVQWDEKGLKFSSQALQPWGWPSGGFPPGEGWSILDRWLVSIFTFFATAFLVVGILTFRIGNDGGKVVGLGKRTQARKDCGDFSHYHVSSIPSTNLLVVPGVVGQQPQSDVAAPASARFWLKFASKLEA